MVWVILSENGSGMKDKFIMRPQGDALETEDREPGSLLLSSAESCWFWGVTNFSHPWDPVLFCVFMAESGSFNSLFIWHQIR